MGIRATIDGIEVPVKSEDIPAFTFSLLDLESPDKLTGSRSTTFRMPATRDVRAVLGGPGMSEAVTNIRPLLRIGNGSEVLYESLVVPVERSVDEYSVVAVGDNAEWFDLAKGTKLTDIDMGVSEPITDTLMRESWVDDEQALTFPIIDFGSFEDRGPTFNVTVPKLRPAIRVHSFLRTAFAAWGYSIKVMGSLAGLWKKLVIPNTSGDVAIGEDILRFYSAEFARTDSPTFTSPTALTEFTFNSIVSDPSGSETGVGRYTAAVNMDVRAVFNYNVTGSVIPVIGSGFVPTAFVNIQLYNFTTASTVSGSTIVMNPAETSYIGTLDFGQQAFVLGNVYGLRIQVSSIGVLSASATFNPSTSVDYEVVNVEYQENVTLNIAQQAPNMSVMDVLKAIASNQCLIIRTNNARGEVEIWRDAEFYRGTDVGIDWSDRINHRNAPTKEVPIYTRRLEYRWKEDNDDRDLLALEQSLNDPGYGNYDAVLPNGSAKPSEIELPFAATAMGTLFGGGVFAPVSRKDEGTYQEDDYKREPRLLIMDGMATGDWRFDGVDETEYPKCYFINPTGAWTLAFGSGEVYGDRKLGTAQVQWSERVRRMMAPKLNGDVMIWPHEISSMDQGVPRLVNDGFDDVWVHVQQINQFVFARPDYTQCVMVPV